MSEVDFGKLLESDKIRIPQVGDVIKGRVITASKSEVKLDIDGILMGIVRGPELYYEAPEFSDLNPGDEIEATVIEEENESGLVELSFRAVGQEKAWQLLREAYRDKEPIKVKITDANKGGLLSRFRQIAGFLPVSQLAPDNYPRVSGGDKSRILEKLKGFVGQEMQVTVITLNESDNKIIFSEKDIWNRRQKPALDKYQPGMVVEGKITAITNFGVFVNFDEGMEGLIHISELAWQRIDSPGELYQVGDKVKAEIVSVDGAKIFLSLKRLMTDPWLEASAKYKIGQTVPGSILKVNPFGLFVKLDEEIHGLAHVSQLGLGAKEKISDTFKVDEVRDFEIVNISPEEHRLGLKLAGVVSTEAATEAPKKAKKESKKKDEEKEETAEEKEVTQEKKTAKKVKEK
ncbi:MAG: S1 RNA-binding domain-containing protein [Candidatus Parcubacteria bacterium]|jgi:small subunit ribosomal protein S1|nr:MAG: S1 RNA-binding domain-containing protein [Candidatus Parcubacteria bacterium]